MSLRLNTFGGLSVLRDGQEIGLPVQRRARTALLVYLAVERETTREKVASVFWPESDEEKARHALSQALYQMRQTLGDDWLLLDGDRIRVLSSLQVDAESFEAAVEAESYDVALQLFRSPFLSGVDNLPNTKAFESWLDGKRAHYERLHRRARRAVINAHAEADDIAAAITAARAWVQIDPSEDEAQHRLIELLAASGQPLEAVRQYEVHERLLAADDLEPLDQTKILVDKIRAQDIGGAIHMRDTHAAPAPGVLLHFFNELRRRHVFSVSGAYLVLSWLLVEVSATTFPMLRLPTWAPTLVLVFALLGLPVVVFFSWVFDITPEGIRRTPSLRSPQPGLRGGIQRVASLTASSMVVLIAGWAVLAALTLGEEELDRNVVAVLPFTAVGSDPAVLALGEGIAVLLATRLNGEASLRAADPQSMFAKLNELLPDDQQDVSDEIALTTARGLQAGRLLRGSVVGTLGRITFAASLFDVNTGRRALSATVEGPLDSLTTLVDRLAASLLGLEAGESEDRLATLTSTSLPAVQAYLAGETKFRRGLPHDAAGDYERALEHDSTFALAALRLWYALGWSSGRTPERMTRGARLTCDYRDRLNARDRLRATAVLGCNGETGSDIRSAIQFIDRATLAAGDDPQLWLLLGDRLFHNGAVLGLQDWGPRATAAFQRALQLGHPYPFEAEQHLLEMYAASRDTAALSRLVAESEDIYTDSDEMLGPKWILAAAFNDTVRLGQVRARFDRLSMGGAGNIASTAQGAGFYVEDAEAAVRALRPAAQEERNRLFLTTRMFSLNTGRPSWLANAERELIGGQPSPPLRLAEQVAEALYWDGDSVVAQRAVRQLEAIAPTITDDPLRRRVVVCGIALWSLHHDDTARLKPHLSFIDTTRALCGYAARALLRQREGAARAKAALDSLDAFMTSNVGGMATTPAVYYANLIAARLHEQRGEMPEALAAARRRPTVGNPPVLLSSFLREEGRLAAQVGDTAGAIRAYSHYLALRYNPDPHLKPEADRIRLELARLTSNKR